MKTKSKSKRIVLLGLGVVLVGVVVTALVLTFIQSSFFGELAQFRSAEIYGAGTRTQVVVPPIHRDAVSDDPQSRNNLNELDDALQRTQFRILIAILEGRWNTSPRFALDNEGERQQVFRPEWNSIEAGQNQFMVVLHWGSDNIQSITVQGQEVRFDTMRMIFGDSNGEIGTIRVYAYVHGEFASEFHEDIEDRYIVPFYVFGNTTLLYRTIDRWVG